MTNTPAAPTLLDEPLRVQAFGVTVEIAVEAPELRAAAARYLPPGWEPANVDAQPVATLRLEPQAGATGLYRTLVNGSDLAGPVESAVALGIYDSQLRGAIAEFAEAFTFVHAGVVCLDGRALVLPGRSFAGKSTLVAALLARGAGYCSDEYAVLDSAGLVHPYPRPLSMRPTDASLGEWTATAERDAAEYGARTWAHPTSIALIASLRYARGGTWAVQPVGLAGSALLLVANAATARTRSETAFAHASRAVAGATTIQGQRGEAAAAAEHLTSLMASI